nr:EAL domain-containing protein [uncultured Agathobaculum sp.]
MKYLQKLVAVLVVSIALLCNCATAYALAPSDTVVRVGFPIQDGISYIDEDGNYAGYLVDYLDQLTLFTNWQIEYVQVEGDVNTQLSTLLDQLENGEIDMMGTMNRNANLEDLFLYPDYSYGSTYTVLAVRDDSSYIVEDFSNWDGITIASYPRMEARMELLDQYAKVNGFTYQVEEYETYEEIINAVFAGEADAVLQVDISMRDGLRSIGRFSPSPYYFVLSPEREDLLPQLNSALEIMSISYENLQRELYDRYFLDASDFFRASKDELEYIQSLGPLRVLFFTGNAPFQYMQDGQLKGFAVEYFDDFAKSVGLQYEAVIEDDLSAATELVKNGQVDLIACIATDSALSYENGICLSLPYFSSYAIRTYSTQHKKTHEHILGFNMDTEEALRNVLSDDTCCAWIDGYSLNYYLRKEVVYDDIVTDWADTKEFCYAAAVLNTLPNADKMVSLLNQYASSISNQETQALLSACLLDKMEYTPKEWVLANRSAIIVISISAILILGVLGFYIYHKKMAYKTLVSENKVLHLSIYDELTGAYNRTYFCKLMEQRIARGESGALIALNIHNFKYINDTYGTHRADQLLCKMKDILATNLREGEILCRPSGDCFYLTVSDYLPEDIKRRVEGLRAQMKVMAEDLLDGYRISLYCGAVSSATSPDLSNTQTNLNCLIVALAHAKRESGSVVCMYNDSMHQEEQLRQYIEANMHRALAENEYQVYLQPKMNLRTGQIDSAEALVRWKTKERGLLFPDQFIPLFEHNGFCKQLDLYMLEKSCQLLRSWMDAGIPPITISINQTKALFVSDDYVDALLEITSRYQVSPQYIVLEILEGLAFENSEQLNDTIARLNHAGFRVSMDDFGSGYSSLNTLGKLHIDQIKLDRMFLMDLRQEQRSSQYEVMRSIFSLAKTLGIETVTEGVETQKDEELVRSMGCDYGQGYYYSKPIPADVFFDTFLKRD